MNKNFKILGAAMLCSLMAAGVSSCSDEPNGDAVVVIPGGTDENGKPVGDLRLSSMGGYNIEYNADGTVKSVSNNYEKLVINGNKLEFYDDDELDNVCDLKWNGDGYITKISSKLAESDEDYSVNGTGEFSISYDGKGHITKFDSKASYSGKEDGYKFSEEATRNFTLTWDGDKLVSMEGKGKWTAKYGSEQETETYSYKATYTYGNNVNKYLQMPVAVSAPILTEMDETGTEQVLAAIGLFGKGPSVLPSRLEATETDGDGDTDNSTYNFSYSLNSDGSIARETVNYKNYYWNYGAVADTKAFGNDAESDGHSMFFFQRKRGRK